MPDQEKKEYPSEEQWTTDETKEEIKEEMDTGEKNEDVYSDEGREQLLEDDEISAEEEGFSAGAEGGSQLAKCAHCHKLLGDESEHVIEREINEEKYVFCSEECAEKFAKS